jgi:hypothetical protein
MSKIQDVNNQIIDFLIETIGTEAKVISITKDGDNWIGIAEIFEESNFIKAIGLNTNVKDRNLYEVKLDENLDVISFNRTEGALS